MADLADGHLRKGNGSIGQTTDTDGGLVADPVRSPAPLAPTPSDVPAALTRRIDRLTEELAEARRQGGQVGSTLAKRTSRMHQLLGERDRLASLLAARDTELLRLTRKLALAERAAPASPGILTAARTVLDKVWHARKVPERSPSPSAPAAAMERPAPELPLVPWHKDGPPKAVLGVVVFGLSEAEIERVLGIVERHCIERDLVPLLLTDHDAFQVFRGRRMLFEYLPARAEQERFAAELDWPLFTLRRLALIRRKWQPVQVIAFGRTAAEVVRRWLDSPFEATPIPASLKGGSERAGLDWSEAQQPWALQP